MAHMLSRLYLFPSKWSPASAHVTVSIIAIILNFNSLWEVSEVSNISPHKEIKWHNIRWVWRPQNWSITPNPVPREMHVKKFYELNMEMHHLAGTSHFSWWSSNCGNWYNCSMPRLVINVTVCYTKKKRLRTSSHDKAHQTFTCALSLLISQMV